jgi:hypothetical protein
MEMDVAYSKIVSWHSTGGNWEHQKTTTVRLISIMSEIRPSLSSIKFIKFSAPAN